MRVVQFSGRVADAMVRVAVGLALTASAALALDLRGSGVGETAEAATDPSDTAAKDEKRKPPADQAPVDTAATPGFAERVLREREILGTQFRGHLFVDGLPVGPDGVQIGQALELRRLRVTFKRSMAFRWEAVGSAELASGRVELKDLYVRRHFASLGTITFGNQNEPMGLDKLTSQLARPLLEPSMATALAPGRNFGIAVGNRYGNWQYQVGMFGAGTQQEGRRDLGSAFTGRLTHRTIEDDGSDVRHLGLSLSVRQLAGTESFRSVPEVGIGQEFLVDTGTIENADSTRRVALEYLETFGRWSVRSEVMRVRVARELGSDLEFGGSFVEAGWVAWGDGERYDDGKAVSSSAPVKSRAHWGDAWGRGNMLLTARLSRIDLSDNEIQGGTETNLSLGAAWALNERGQIAANLVRFIDLTGPNAQAEKSMALAVRVQYVW